MSPRPAVILLDLQVDFLDQSLGRMPVSRSAAEGVIRAANAVLCRQTLAVALPIVIVNEFARSDHVANFLRHNAAISGSVGCLLDRRVHVPPSVRIFPKSKPSAFTNPELEAYLRANSITELAVLGVFAEGCVRATALDAQRRGYRVVVPENEIGTNASWKKAFALWALRRGGVTIIPSIFSYPLATHLVPRA